MAAPKGNRNAAKAARDRADVVLGVRLHSRDKARLVRAAKGRGVTVSALAKAAVLAALAEAEARAAK